MLLRLNLLYISLLVLISRLLLSIKRSVIVRLELRRCQWARIVAVIN